MELLKKLSFNLLYCILITASLFSSSSSFSQGNCLVYPEDSGERIACELSYRAVEYRQGSKESQLLFDKGIELGPEYAWAYYEKSVPYFKRGLLSEGVALLNKAIEIAPLEYLFYRAFWYFQHGSYEACIADLEKHYTELKGPMILNPPGNMEMRIILGMSYGLSGDFEKGVATITDCLKDYDGKEYLIGFYDYHVLGILNYLNGNTTDAINAFQKQLEVKENFADTYYYIGLIKKQQNETEASSDYFKKCLQLIDGENEGFSENLFADFNISRDLVEAQLSD
jgi:tetratricopeptide (TPR) repeat protein